MGSSRTLLSSLSLAALLGACGGGDAAPPGTTARRDVVAGPGAPGIVLVCLDTVRADAIDRMKALSAFARDATRFVDASSSAAWTAPSVASLLTGLETSGHGVIGSRQAPPLARSAVTIAEMLREAGWDTAAVTEGIWVSPAQGFEQGFGRFDTGFDINGPEASVGAWARGRPAGKPFFLFLHTYAAHDPYGTKTRGYSGDAGHIEEVEAEMREALEAAAGRPVAAPLDPAALRRLGVRFQTDQIGRAAYLRWARPPLADAILSQVNAWYDGDYARDPASRDVPALLRGAYERGLEWADIVLERTLKALAAAELPEGTVVAIVSDHGEAFGEHGVLGHGSDLHDEVLRVPLLLRAPGRLASGAVRGSCGLVDVTPTLLALAGVPCPGDVAGRSLLPLARETETGHPVVAEAQTLDASGLVRRTLRTTSVRTESAKVLVTWDVATREILSERLYDLAFDPREATPLEPTDLGRYGASFCTAVGRVRARLAPRASAEPACGAAIR